MKKLFSTCLAAILMICLAIPLLGMARPAHGKGPKAAAAPEPEAAALTAQGLLAETPTDLDYSGFSAMSTDELWTSFAQAEAQKKLCELKEQALHEQIKLYEGPEARYYYYYNGGYSSDAYAQLLELKNQEYALKLQKEQYEWEKRQVEEYLRLTGARMGREELRYALYAGLLTSSGLGYDELYTRRYELQMQEEQLELQKKTLEYQYRAGQISDSDFVAQYASVFLQKEETKSQREQTDVELELAGGMYAPGRGPGALLP